MAQASPGQVNLHLKVDETVHSRLKELARREKRSLAGQMRHLLERGLQQEESAQEAA